MSNLSSFLNISMNLLIFNYFENWLDLESKVEFSVLSAPPAALKTTKHVRQAFEKTYHFAMSFQNCGIDEIKFETYDWTGWIQKQLKALFSALCSRGNSRFWSFLNHYDLTFQNYGINEIRFETYHWTDWAQKQLKVLFQCSMLSSKPKHLEVFSTFRPQFSKLWHFWN